MKSRRTMRSLIDESIDLIGPDGRIAQAIPNYEVRPEQQAMCEAVAEALERREHLLVEAGTGVGKTYAYLIPMILWAVREGERVVLSTFTKTLQDQLITKDLPLLRKALGNEFRFEAAFGSRNYVCLRRMNRAPEVSLFESSEDVAQLRAVRDWAGRTETGLRMDLDFEPNSRVWSLVNRDPDLCMGRDSPFYEPCLYQQARRRQANAHILVVNHHLFFANVAADGNLLPDYGAVVFDEAHNIEEVAADFFAAEFSNTSLRVLLNRIGGLGGERGLLSSVEDLPAEIVEDAARLTSEVWSSAQSLFMDVQARLLEVSSRRAGQQTTRITERGFVDNGVRETLSRVISLLQSARRLTRDEEDRAELEALEDRASEMNSTLQAILELELSEYVYWAEVDSGSSRERIALRMAPIEVSSILAEQVFGDGKSCVLTSATLATGGSFEFARRRLGTDNAGEKLLSSPFRYDEQVTLYAPEDLPDPRSGLDEFTKAAVQRTKMILEITNGATFVLFTSFNALNYAHEILSRELTKLTFFKQGDMPRERLLREFRRTDGAVLLGTNTFWQGVDVPGDALIAVVIVKLPFAVPDHPAVQARLDQIREEGRDPFMEYQVPGAVLMLRQGFGRLVRSATDFGVVAILDPRLHRRGYGRQFLRALPQCRTAVDLAEVKQFFEGKINPLK